MTVRVRATEVAGGIETVQNTVPVSSSGTRPDLVVNMVTMSTAMPATTVMIMAMGLRTSFSTLFLYLPRIES